MHKHTRSVINIPVIISAALAIVLLISLWQNYRSGVYEAILEKNIFLLNENLMRYQRLEKEKPDSGSEAAAYLKWRFVLKEQVDQTSRIFTDKAAALKDSGKDKILASLLYYNVGLAQTISANFSAAIEAFEEAVKLDPKNGYSYYNLGMLYSTYTNDRAKALYCYKKYLEIFPEGGYSAVVEGRIKELEELKP